MRVVPPLSITEIMLTSTTADEPGIGEADWSAGATYASGDRAILGAPTATVTITTGVPCTVNWTAHGLGDGTLVFLSTTGTFPTGLTADVPYYVVNSTTDAFEVSVSAGGAPVTAIGTQSGTHTGTAQVHRIFESLQGGNTGHPPTLAHSAAWWEDVGPTNAWAMFDLLRNTATQIASPLTVVLTPGQRVNALGLLGLVADHVEITMTSGGSTVYSYSADLADRDVVDAYSYFFEPFSTDPSVVRFDLPPYTNGVITVSLTRASGYVSCGGVVLGTFVDLGETVHNPVADAVNFSTIDRDAFGNSILVPRRSVPKTNQTAICDSGAVNRIRAVRDLLNAKPALWSWLDDLDNDYAESGVILGIYRVFSITMDIPGAATVALEIEEN